MPAQTRGGRPKTANGHRDDAMLAFLEYEGCVDALILLDQKQYRERRALHEDMKEHLRSAAVSWRYGELVDGKAP